MLKNDLYTIHDYHGTEDSATASLLLRPDHPLFAGHFPGRPVLPGACMLQMIKEIMETTLNLSLQLTHSPAIKFLSPVIPADNPALKAELSWQVEGGLIRVQATLATGTTPCFRFAGTFRPLA
jgi:3-hydroxyacyl-[acyl-carrier-protein] dehydratase